MSWIFCGATLLPVALLVLVHAPVVRDQLDLPAGSPQVLKCLIVKHIVEQVSLLAKRYAEHDGFVSERFGAGWHECI